VTFHRLIALRRLTTLFGHQRSRLSCLSKHLPSETNPPTTTTTTTTTATMMKIVLALGCVATVSAQSSCDADVNGDLTVE